MIRIQRTEKGADQYPIGSGLIIGYGTNEISAQDWEEMNKKFKERVDGFVSAGVYRVVVKKDKVAAGPSKKIPKDGVKVEVKKE